MNQAAPLLALLLTACGEDAPADPCGEPMYAGEATDEAWRTMVDGEDRAAAGDPNAPVLSAPTEGQVFAASDAPPRFSWTSPIALGPARPATTQLAAHEEEGWLADLWELIIP